MASRFSEITQAPPIEVFAVMKSFTDDANPKKVNLSVGGCDASQAAPWCHLELRRRVRSRQGAKLGAQTINPHYPFLPAFPHAACVPSRSLRSLTQPARAESVRATGIQTLSGTGGLRVAADFLHSILKHNTFYYSTPTWGNHRLIFLNAGFTEAKQYRYWDEKTKGLDFAGWVEDLRNAPENSVIIMHACAHNPTGVDPTMDQWKEIADVCEERKLFPLFDSAYQGFASGDLDKDAQAIRYFASRGFEMLITQSFAKNFGLYNERVGNMVILVKDPAVIVPMRSQITLIVRGNYSNPPNHGARIVSRVLNDPARFQQWRDHILTMSGRIKEMRTGLRERLEKLGTPGTWGHITDQIGMFSFTGLTAVQAKHLADKYSIYLLSSGRINICGLTTGNIDYVAEAINDAVLNVK
ncbi:unnamed protein product, partial [Meganyctiphanes norvegica]